MHKLSTKFISWVPIVTFLLVVAFAPMAYASSPTEETKTTEEAVSTETEDTGIGWEDVDPAPPVEEEIATEGADVSVDEDFGL